MNKIKLLLLAFLFIGPLHILKSQPESYSYDLEQFVYWFHIKTYIKPQKVTSKPIYMIRLGEEEPKYGTVNEYEYDLWKQLQEGTNLLIGPFLDYYDAKYAMETYRLQNKTVDNRELEIQNAKNIQVKSEYYWYFLTFRITAREGSYSLKRIPAAVASGEFMQFKEVLTEGLSWQKLAIGPFPSQNEAEESKRLNRLEEDE